jgi:hypothetical protein
MGSSLCIAIVDICIHFDALTSIRVFAHQQEEQKISTPGLNKK